ncbi:hypothetical protein ACFQ3N_05030 [Virgibacillus byunsanensis]|uniref:DUF1700 domain-containing protein n=1 Tax=Virgibacillus byunsanensis TaxID=570945 RepID=A0ABW3LJV6_9BACI
MIVGEDQFFQELKNELADHPEIEKILADYELHVYELSQEESMDEQNMYNELVNRLGAPHEIARLWQQEIDITPRKMQWLFVLFNIGIFIGGGLLTISYNVFHWNWIDLLWVGLTGVPSVIIFIYILFWGLLGYEIGKEFGHSGLKLLRKTFLFSIVPNLVLMYLVIFGLIPHNWFQPLLNVPFIIVCIVFTAFLYPISWLGYRWGRKISV